MGKKDKFWTLVYQIDNHCKRLLWIGQDRTEETFNLFFEVFGTEFCAGIRFICSDMWKPYLNAKVKLTLKRSYGFRTENAREVTLYHALEKLPEPSFTHSFFR